jgi:phage terminase large subunit
VKQEKNIGREKMPQVEINTSVLNKAYIPYLDEMARTQVYFGGAASGKSVFLAQRDIIDIMKGGRNFLICRQVGRTLRGSVIQEVVKIINKWGLQSLFTINKTDGTILCSNGYQMVFVGLDDTEKLKSLTPAKGVWTDVRVEEATETEQSSIKQLLKRQRGGDENTKKRLTLSFNPVLKTSWIYREYFLDNKWADDQKEFHSDDLSILKTTYRDNAFLTKEDIYGLENEKDQYYYSVYTEGNWGVLGDVIFKNIHYVDLNQPGEYYLPVEQRTNRRNGLDFGFSSDPAAMPCMHLDKMRKRIYFFDELYERGLTNQELAPMVTALIGRERVVCDSSEPKSIQELQIAGVNASGAKKGKDSVNFGVQWLQGYEIIIGLNCVNAYREFTTYHWKKNKDGESLRIPVDKDNHLIDGARYGLEDDMDSSEWSVL